MINFKWLLISMVASMIADVVVGHFLSLQYSIPVCLIIGIVFGWIGQYIGSEDV